MNKVLTTICLTAALFGCTIPEEENAKFSDPTTVRLECTDFRDGEKFTILASGLGKGRGGIFGPACVDVESTDGKKRQLCNDQQAYIKCEGKQS